MVSNFVLIDFFLRNSGSGDQATQSAPGNLGMIGDRKGRDVAFFNENNMTAALPHGLPAEFLERSNDLFGF
jgi:hypothetical protein